MQHSTTSRRAAALALLLGALASPALAQSNPGAAANTGITTRAGAAFPGPGHWQIAELSTSGQPIILTAAGDTLGDICIGAVAPGGWASPWRMVAFQGKPITTGNAASGSYGSLLTAGNVQLSAFFGTGTETANGLTLTMGNSITFTRDAAGNLLGSWTRWAATNQASPVAYRVAPHAYKGPC